MEGGWVRGWWRRRRRKRRRKERGRRRRRRGGLTYIRGVGVGLEGAEEVFGDLER